MGEQLQWKTPSMHALLRLTKYRGVFVCVYVKLAAQPLAATMPNPTSSSAKKTLAHRTSRRLALELVGLTRVIR